MPSWNNSWWLFIKHTCWGAPPYHLNIMSCFGPFWNVILAWTLAMNNSRDENTENFKTIPCFLWVIEWILDLCNKCRKWSISWSEWWASAKRSVNMWLMLMPLVVDTFLWTCVDCSHWWWTWTPFCLLLLFVQASPSPNINSSNSKNWAKSGVYASLLESDVIVRFQVSRVLGECKSMWVLAARVLMMDRGHAVLGQPQWRAEVFLVAMVMWAFIVFHWKTSYAT